MTSLYDHLSLRELKDRADFHQKELKRITKEIEKREKEGNYYGNLWEPLDVLKKKNNLNFVLPTEVETPSRKEERKLTKEGNADIKNMILQAKNNIKNEIKNEIVKKSINPEVLRFLNSSDSNTSNTLNSNKNIKNNVEEDDEEEDSSESEIDGEDVDETSSEVVVKETNILKQLNLGNVPQQTKKKVIRKKKEEKTYEDLNPTIRDLWSKD